MIFHCFLFLEPSVGITFSISTLIFSFKVICLTFRLSILEKEGIERTEKGDLCQIAFGVKIGFTSARNAQGHSWTDRVVFAFQLIRVRVVDVDPSVRGAIV